MEGGLSFLFRYLCHWPYICTCRYSRGSSLQSLSNISRDYHVRRIMDLIQSFYNFLFFIGCQAILINSPRTIFPFLWSSSVMYIHAALFFHYPSTMQWKKYIMETHRVCLLLWWTQLKYRHLFYIIIFLHVFVCQEKEITKMRPTAGPLISN